jgi:hypothetical protein
MPNPPTPDPAAVHDALHDPSAIEKTAAALSRVQEVVHESGQNAAIIALAEAVQALHAQVTGLAKAFVHLALDDALHESEIESIADAVNVEQDQIQTVEAEAVIAAARRPLLPRIDRLEADVTGLVFTTTFLQSRVDSLEAQLSILQANG